MNNEPDTTPIHTLYAQRFSADLETNRKEQEVVAGQLAELEVRLKQLKADEHWLCGMQGGLSASADENPAATADGTAAPTGPEAPQPLRSPADEAPAAPSASAGAAAGAVPQPRQARKATGTARARKAPQAKEASSTAASATKGKTAARKPAVRKPAVRKPAAAAVTTSAEPVKAETKPVKGETPLRELVLTLLVGTAEPRMVSEVAAELAQAHPGRPASVQVVRNTLEALAKKGLIEKEHKQGSVMYSAPRPAEGTPHTAASTATEAAQEKESVEV
ncbi:hypothetical protein ACFWUZ_11835 [Streptomyces sp. NPDC058646]|uniref:hypothetical protein n=1 Tax=Streptomyces sp. NPDC058646 TaxID=3346574 RepID=UPI00365C6B20